MSGAFSCQLPTAGKASRSEEKKPTPRFKRVTCRCKEGKRNQPLEKWQVSPTEFCKLFQKIPGALITRNDPDKSPQERFLRVRCGARMPSASGAGVCRKGLGETCHLGVAQDETRVRRGKPQVLVYFFTHQRSILVPVF